MTSGDWFKSFFLVCWNKVMVADNVESNESCTFVDERMYLFIICYQ